MKTKIKLIVAAIAIVLFAFTSDSGAGICEERCVPNDDCYCSYGSGLDVEFCGPGWDNMHPIKPIDFLHED